MAELNALVDQEKKKKKKLQVVTTPFGRRGLTQSILPQVIFHFLVNGQ